MLVRRSRKTKHVVLLGSVEFPHTLQTFKRNLDDTGNCSKVRNRHFMCFTSISESIIGLIPWEEGEIVNEFCLKAVLQLFPSVIYPPYSTSSFLNSSTNTFPSLKFTALSSLRFFLQKQSFCLGESQKGHFELICTLRETRFLPNSRIVFSRISAADSTSEK